MLRKNILTFSFSATLIVFFLFSAAHITSGVDAYSTRVKHSPSGTSPTAHCYCKAIQNKGKSAGSSISNPIIDFGILKTYSGLFPQKDENQTDCVSLCQQKAANDANFNNKTWLCQHKGCPSGQHTVTAYAAVGTRDYTEAQSTPVFTCTGGVTSCKCPTGWTCNGCSPQVAGGITTDGKCKKVACQPIGITPLPPNNTQVGSWGFVWGNALVAWGTSANGGAPTCTTTPCVGH